ncbi:MAG: hypothetical protein K9G71_01370 [Rhodobacteraceae bacterium]|nr:hypothetical protein [Paracoccaceae bacterium]MCF8512977.1 hypothetical protein [Paracoccaceae bacterium]MCF8517222.1 hypothetical protein [Paracoccaceae bacterium]
MDIVLPHKLQVIDILRKLSEFECLSAEPKPERINFDFSQVTAVRATGVVFVHNVTKHLHGAGCKVYYSHFKRPDSRAMRYLDSIGFFQDKFGEYQFAGSTPRKTSSTLKEVKHQDCHFWASRTFLPWLSQCSNRSLTELAEVEMCIKEIFNNIQDHAGLEIGSIFAQWYPKQEFVDIAISDFGRGIPANVREVLPELSPAECIIQAFEDGFSTKSKPTNRGAGLYLLRQNVVTNLHGTINVVSGGGIALCDLEKGLRSGNFVLGNHGYNGTLINIRIPTAAIEDDDDGNGSEAIWD